MSAGSTAPVWVCEIAYGGRDSASPIQAMGLGSFHGIGLPLLSGQSGLNGVVNLSGDGFAALSDLFVAKVTAFLRSSTLDWQPWTAASPKALVLDAGASADSVSARLQDASADDTPVLDQLEADNSVPAQTKDLVIRQVLNGRIFSAHLDQRFHNPTLWV